MADPTAETGTLYVREADGTYRTATAADPTDGTVTFYKKTAEATAGTEGTRPFNASAYYQIYDVDVYEGNAALRSRRQNVQPYGMDYSWTLIAKGRLGVHAPLYGEFYGSPNFPAVNGFTTMTNSVLADEALAANDGQRALAAMGLVVTNAAQVNYNDALKKNAAGEPQTLYAQTGTHAVMRKPLVRVWSTVSEYSPEAGKTSNAVEAVNETYYVDTEADRRQINVHIENRYWLNDQPYQWQYNNTANVHNGTTYNSKYHNNYAVDGGSKGSLTLPVLTVVLPYGVAPYSKTTGQPYSIKGENKGMANWTLATEDWDVSAVVGADADNYDNLTATPAPAGDATGYQTLASVNDNMAAAWKEANWDATYAFEPVTTDTGSVEWRYVLRFEPKATGYNDARDLVTQIVSGGLDTFKFNVLTYDEPKMGLDPASMTKSYENIRAFVTSKVDGAKHLVDEDIKVANAAAADRVTQSAGMTTGNITLVAASDANPFTPGAEAQLGLFGDGHPLKGHQKKLTWLKYRAEHSNWTTVNSTTYNNIAKATGYYLADKRLDATESTYYEYEAQNASGSEYAAVPRTEGFIPAKYIKTGDPKTGASLGEKVPYNYLAGYNGTYTERYGTIRSANALGGLPAAGLPLVGTDTVTKDPAGEPLA